MAPRLCKCYNSPTTPLKVLWRKFAVMASLKVGRHVNAFWWKKYLGKLELYVQLFLSLSWLCSSLVPRLSRAPSSFWSLAVCKNGGGRPSLFYHVNDISVYLGRQRGEGYVFFILNQERCHFRLANVWNSSAWGKNYKKRLQAPSYDRGPLPPLSTKVDTDIIHVIKWTKRQKLHGGLLMNFLSHS